MHEFTFLNSERMAWAAAPPPEAVCSKGAPVNFVSRTSLEIVLLIFQRCGLMDLVMLREVCRYFLLVLDSNPSVWANVRAKTLNMPPPPLGSSGVRRTEHAWTVHVLTGTTDTQQDIELKWNASYITKYKHNRGDNLRTVEGHLRSDNPGQDIGKQQLRRMFQEYVRSPTCDELLRVHERDLKVVNYATWTVALPVIRHELGLISACDPYRVPRGFQFYPNDRILCPACHADPEAARQHAISLPFPRSREWFKNNTVQVMSIYRHYRAQHKDLLARHGIRAIPRIDCYACCAVCRQLPVEQRPQHGLLYTIRGLRDHYQEFHGVANPGLVDHPLNSVEIENSMEIKGCSRSELRPRVF